MFFIFELRNQLFMEVSELPCRQDVVPKKSPKEAKSVGVEIQRFGHLVQDVLYCRNIELNAERNLFQGSCEQQSILLFNYLECHLKSLC